MELPDLIDEVRACIVQITLTVMNPTPEVREQLGGKDLVMQPVGTGFFVDDQAHVVTAKHVLDGMRRTHDEIGASAQLSAAVSLAYPNTENMRGNFQGIGFEVIDVDADHDLALLKMARNPFAGEASGGIVLGSERIDPLYAVPELNPARPRDGEAIAISGYPLGEPVLVTNRGVVASSWSLTIDEAPQAGEAGPAMPRVHDSYLADVQTNPGNSGGPAYGTADGSVLGVLVAGKLTDVIAAGEPAIFEGLTLRADAGLSIIVPTKYVVELLEKNGVGWVRSGDRT